MRDGADIARPTTVGTDVDVRLRCRLRADTLITQNRDGLGRMQSER